MSGRVRPLAVAAIIVGSALIAAVALGSGALAPAPTGLPALAAASVGLPLDLPPEESPAGTPTAPPPSPAVSALPSPAPSPSAARERVATRIRIRALGIDLPIYEGDAYTAQLNKAAHYPGTAWPGGGSNIYLYGHAREGMFIALWKAQPGQEVELVLEDGDSAFYTITRVLRRVRWDDMSMVAPTPTEELRLQTCVSYGQTAPRFVVIAVPATAPGTDPGPSPSPTDS